jgi:hypothetical protein
MTCYRDSYQESSWHGRLFVIGSCELSKRRRRSERYPVLRITVPQKRDESGFRSLPNARVPWATRKCYVSSFSSLRTLIQTRCFDVTNGVDLEVKGFVKGAQGAFKCSLSLACEVCVTPIFHDAIFSSAIQSEHDSWCIVVVRTEMQCVLYQPKIELRTRSMSHLLSSVDPVLYCDSVLRHQRANSRADCFIVACSIGCSIGCFISVCFLLRLGHCGLCAASSCFTERCAVHCLCTIAAGCVVVRFIHSALLRALILSMLVSNATDPANHHRWINHESSMTINTCQSSIDQGPIV